MSGRSRFRGLIHCKLGFTLLRFSGFRLAQMKVQRRFLGCSLSSHPLKGVGVPAQVIKKPGTKTWLKINDAWRTL